MRFLEKMRELTWLNQKKTFCPSVLFLWARGDSFSVLEKIRKGRSSKQHMSCRHKMSFEYGTEDGLVLHSFFALFFALLVFRIVFPAQGTIDRLDNGVPEQKSRRGALTSSCMKFKSRNPRYYSENFSDFLAQTSCPAVAHPNRSCAQTSSLPIWNLDHLSIQISDSLVKISLIFSPPVSSSLTTHHVWRDIFTTEPWR